MKRSFEMKNKFVFASLAILALVLSACNAGTVAAPTTTTAPLPDTQVMVAPTDTVAPAMATAAPAMVTPSGPATVNLSQNATLGAFLVDSQSMTLYIFLKDTPNTSACTAACAAKWPPLLTNGAPVGGTGVTPSMLGTTTRADGSVQVTYNSWPLYYFAGDKAAGDTNGMGLANVWYVINPQGMSAAPTSTPTAAAATSGAATINVGTSTTLGSFLVDSKGMTLYLFTNDTPNTSTCYDSCAGYWPPLLTTGAPIAGTGVTASMLGTTKRTDGTTQVTYNGWPLYYYASDTVAGDTTGENVQSIWFVVTPAGAKK
jgi:predicted lipoprotein with Yx(FWY)xxD motif